MYRTTISTLIILFSSVFVVAIFCFLIAPPNPLACRAAHGLNGSLHLPPVYALGFITHLRSALPQLRLSLDSAYARSPRAFRNRHYWRALPV